jgi:hypothetical protein
MKATPYRPYSLQRAKVRYFRICDLRSADAKVFMRYSQMKLLMKREALQKLNRRVNENSRSIDTERPNLMRF